MLATLPLLEKPRFPALRRNRLETLQVNLGYRCNQQCLHCHVNAGPRRTELMGHETVEQILAFLRASRVSTLDITGGAPEPTPHGEKKTRNEKAEPHKPTHNTQNHARHLGRRARTQSALPRARARRAG